MEKWLWANARLKNALGKQVEKQRSFPQVFHRCVHLRRMGARPRGRSRIHIRIPSPCEGKIPAKILPNCAPNTANRTHKGQVFHRFHTLWEKRCGY